MSDPGKWYQEVEDAHQAALLLENELLVSVFKRIETETIQEWRDSEDYDKSLKSDAWMRLRGIDLLKGELESIVNTGKMAAQQLERASGAKKG